MPTGSDNFYTSDTVTVEKVTFKNQYRMTVAGHLFLPKDRARDAKLPAVVVGHPMGAVKEQSADLYATKMAERGFVALSVDLSFWGESEGKPRNAVDYGSGHVFRSAARPERERNNRADEGDAAGGLQNRARAVAGDGSESRIHAIRLQLARRGPALVRAGDGSSLPHDSPRIHQS